MISAHQHTVSEVLGDKFLHEIPPYQRPYAWTPDEAKQLFRDLVEAVEASSSEPYFLGSIVLIRPQGEVAGQVVDGQQRLTTLTILAAVLRDIAEDKNEKDALGAAVYIEPNQFLAQTEAVRVRAHEADRTYFRESIQLPGATAKREPCDTARNEAQSLMWQNAQALRELALGLAIQERQALVRFLLNECVLVVVATESRTAALRIFRVLNDRGLDLSNADVIKADLLSQFPERAEMERQAARWREFENELGRDEFENLLETMRFIREERKNWRALSEAYAEWFRDNQPSAIRDFIENDLRDTKRIYAKVLDADVDDFPAELRARAVEALVGLNLVPNKDWMPAAVAICLGVYPDQRRIDALEKLEGLAWIMQLARRYDTQRMNRYVGLLQALRVGQPSLTDALRPTADEIAEARQSLGGPIYGRFPTRVVRAILERLDRLLAEQPVVWAGQKTVEHILPQNPADGVWDHFSSSEREAITHSLGNLVLLTARKNSGASNLSFAEKARVYFGLGDHSVGKKRASYASVQELAHLEDWDSKTYKERHTRHVGLLANRWGIPPLSS